MSTTRRRDTRPAPTPREAEGMREGILAQRRMQGLTGPHPYGLLDFRTIADRRIIAAVYADMTREAMGNA